MTASRCARGHQGERGATMLELALAVPLLLGLIVGTTELGLAWVSRNRVESAVSQAARVGAVAGSRIDADRDVLLALRASLPAAQLGLVDRVVVFRPLDASGTVPPACVKPVGSLSETGATGCNSYNGGTLRTVSAGSMLGFGGAPGAKDASWAPASRSDQLSGPPDWIGVWVRTRNDPLTSTGVGDIAITSVSIYRIEPDLGT